MCCFKPAEGFFFGHEIRAGFKDVIFIKMFDKTRSDGVPILQDLQRMHARQIGW